MAAITRGNIDAELVELLILRRPSLIKFSSRRARAGITFTTPGTSTIPRAARTVFQRKDEILGPGAARFEIMTRDPGHGPIPQVG